MGLAAAPRAAEVSRRCGCGPWVSRTELLHLFSARAERGSSEQAAVFQFEAPNLITTRGAAKQIGSSMPNARLPVLCRYVVVS